MNSPDKPSETDPARMRASDADRDRVADQLREALAEGRLTADEHAERIDAVYRARTYAELAPIVADLPATGGAAAPAAQAAPPSASPLRDDLPAPRAESASIVAVLSGAERKGRWLVEAHTSVVSIVGGVELDLRQAVLTHREVTINIVAVLGGVSITVPAGVRLVNSVAGVLGGCSFPPEDILPPDAPVIRLTGMALLGGIDVQRRTTDEQPSAGDYRRRQQDIHREFRRKQREVHREFRARQRELRRSRRER